MIISATRGKQACGNWNERCRARKVALHIAEEQPQSVVVRPDDLSDMLGIERHRPEKARRPARVATGLAWTEAGGEVLYRSQPVAFGPRPADYRPSRQRHAESAKAAQSYIATPSISASIPACSAAPVSTFTVPGAVPKDGPSAGVAMAVALTSPTPISRLGATPP